MAKMRSGRKSPHIDDEIWGLAKALTVRQCVGQLVEFNPVTARTRSGRELADLVAVPRASARRIPGTRRSSKKPPGSPPTI